MSWLTLDFQGEWLWLRRHLHTVQKDRNCLHGSLRCLQASVMMECADSAVSTYNGCTNRLRWGVCSLMFGSVAWTLCWPVVMGRVPGALEALLPVLGVLWAWGLAAQCVQRAHVHHTTIQLIHGWVHRGAPLNLGEGCDTPNHVVFHTVLVAMSTAHPDLSSSNFLRPARSRNSTLLAVFGVPSA